MKLCVEAAALAHEIMKAAESEDVADIGKFRQLDPTLLEAALHQHAFQRWFRFNICSLQEDIILALVGLGVDLNRHENQGYAPGGSYPLATAVLRGDLQRATFLLKQGADPNICLGLFSVSSISENTAVRIPMTELLIEYGADVNRELPTIPGYTPLGRAMDSGHEDYVEYLISKGAVLPVIPEREVIRLDLDTIQTRLEDACEKCWLDVREKFPEEKFCLFGLETDSDFVIVNPLFDSEGAIDRDSAARRPSPYHFARVSLDSDAEFYGQQHLSRLSDELNSQYGQAEGFFARYRRIRRLAKIFEGALSNLDKRGLFGTGAERERIILLVSIIDADRGEWNQMLKIAKRLNPKKVFEEFKKTLAL